MNMVPLVDSSLPPLAGGEHVLVDVGDASLHVAMCGPTDGPVFVLLHGWPEHWGMWARVMPRLADAGWRVLAVDLRGCGWSSVPEDFYEKDQLARDVVAALDACGVKDFDLAGHDWGGWVAQLIALMYPDRVRRLTLVNIAPLWTARPVMARNLWRFLYQPVIATPGLGARIERTGWFWKLIARQGVSRADLPQYRHVMNDPARARAGSRIYRSFLTVDSPRIARGAYEEEHLTMPVTVLLGTDDLVIRPSMFSLLRDHASNLTMVEVPGRGHFIVDQDPDRVVSHLLGFHPIPV